MHRTLRREEAVFPAKTTFWTNVLRRQRSTPRVAYVVWELEGKFEHARNWISKRRFQWLARRTKACFLFDKLLATSCWQGPQPQGGPTVGAFQHVANMGTADPRIINRGTQAKESDKADENTMSGTLSIKEDSVKKGSKERTRD
ncbi:hypothetical protein KC19_VG185000 [Ceratodon purpureus]|uniref:Uncharacterized protein n=1 Tax=Ceratodon purpureus TaxID=3225 RepID=A0A8T0HRG4_CERPU|nr:hypothetical protein KC19_VG185000 [Ceratodon purpureus]